MTRTIAFVGDTHVGSMFALFPDNKKYRINLNRGQRKLLEYWKYFWHECDSSEVDTIVHMGDVVEGLNRKNSGLNIMVSDLNIQKDAFVDLITPYIKKRRFYIISGSGYHESLDYRFSEDIAQTLNGTFLGDLANLRIKPFKTVINIAHGVGGTAIYRATKMDREALFMLTAQATGKLKKTDMMIRGHLHYFHYQKTPDIHSLQVPCWKVWEPNRIFIPLYGRKQPDIGGVIVRYESNNDITIRERLYPLPHIADSIKEV